MWINFLFFIFFPLPHARTHFRLPLLDGETKKAFGLVGFNLTLIERGTLHVFCRSKK